MISPAQSRRLEELKAAHVPFVTATVVRVQHPTSAEAGSVAIVLGDGTVEGFVGGVCAEHSVRAYSMAALESDESVLLRILPDPVEGQVPPEGAETSSEEGVVTVKNPCLSGGAIEVFLEPAPPAPRVLVVGDTPVAAAVHRIGAELELELVAYDAADGPAPDVGDLALVVAAHGRDELHALRLALGAEVPYVGLVASERRGAGVLEELRAEGVPAEQLERIDVPAGIPLGSHSPGEIALSILAGIVAIRRGHSEVVVEASPAPAATATSDVASSALAVDPICGMTVAAVASTPSLQTADETVYFCGEGCRSKFEARIEHASVSG